MIADWATVGPGRLSDHQLVLCSIANYHAPTVGKGRWSAPLSLLDDTKFVNIMKTMGSDLEHELTSMAPRTESENPQTIFQNFKTALASAARKRIKEWAPKLDKKIADLKNHILSLQSSPEPIESDPAGAETAALLQERVQKLETNRFGYRRAAVHAKDWQNGEKVGRYWTRQNAPPKPDNIMYELKRSSEGAGYANSTKEMCEIARAFYNDLQSTDPPPPAGAAARPANCRSPRMCGGSTDRGAESCNGGAPHD